MCMMPKSQMKSTPAMKLLSLMAERDRAIQERDMAITQRKAALAELEKVTSERDAAITERDKAIMERDNAINAFQQTYEFMNKCRGHGSPIQQAASPGTNHQYQLMDVQPSPPLLADAPFDHVRQMHITDARPISMESESPKSKWMRKKVQVIPLKSKSACKRTGLNKDLNMSSQTMHSNWKTQNRLGGSRAMENVTADKHDHGNQELRFNKILFDDSRIPGPVCSCTGKLHPCYKWGNCGWQSSCCTTTLSMHPLPVLPHRRYSRMSGRKMSGSVFRKLLIRLAAEGHDLSTPVDLKDHWAKHGTNAYITIK